MNEGIFGLNFLAGYGQARDGLASTSQNSGPACTCSREASFRETLRGRAGYPAETIPGALASYQPTVRSVSDDASHAPMARDIVSEKARSRLDGIERMMRSEDQIRALDALNVRITSYVNPCLRAVVGTTWD